MTWIWCLIRFPTISKSFNNCPYGLSARSYEKDKLSNCENRLANILPNIWVILILGWKVMDTCIHTPAFCVWRLIYCYSSMCTKVCCIVLWDSMHSKKHFNRVCGILTGYAVYSQGMRYIHNSGLQYHGHLTSSNCLVDGRFNLKVTDFGLPDLQRHRHVSQLNNNHEFLESEWWLCR